MHGLWPAVCWPLLKGWRGNPIQGYPLAVILKEGVEGHRKEVDSQGREGNKEERGRDLTEETLLRQGVQMGAGEREKAIEGLGGREGEGKASDNERKREWNRRKRWGEREGGGGGNSMDRRDREMGE